MSEKDKVIKERLGAPDADGVYRDDKFICNTIDYTHDAIIEASAGTGKTYTLQSIVLKLRLEKTIESVKNLLLVTYTEKAAGELRDRIRKVLEEAGCLPSDFDEATICTIHSFCRSLLTEYAFENRVPMQVEVGGTDGDLVHRAVRMALQCNDFKARYGESYDAYMEAAGLKSTDDLVASVEAKLKDCTQRDQGPEAPRLLDEAIRRQLSDIAAKTSFDFAGIEVNARARQGFEDACRAIDAVKGNLAADELPAFIRTAAECALSCSKMNPSVNGHGRGVRVFDLRPDVKVFVEAVVNVRGVTSSQMPADLAFMAWPVFKRFKDEVASLTFDDLVNRAHDVIVDEAKLEQSGKKSVLLESIRKKYRIALVDEFQDTDDVQWEIFKSIFSHQVNTLKGGPAPEQGMLLVVGDPKQAIYSFRGASIAAYLTARGEITKDNAAAPGKPKALHSLDTTRRSSPELVKSFNKIFGDKVAPDHSWFEGMKEGEGSISYEGVEHPPKDTERFHQIDYVSDFGEPVELLESLPGEQQTPAYWSAGYGNKSQCLPVFLRNAAKEMKRLLTLNPAYTTVNPKTGETVEHRFSYRDMCILVRGHADADKAREILAEARIPFSVYKEQGIYASASAEALLALFDFLSAPSRRGRLEALLLTPLFGYRPDQLEARCKQEDREFSSLLDSWQELISKKKWSKFFESVMNDTLLAHPRKDDADFDRSWAATRQILDKLLEQVGRKAQTIDEFADVLRIWRQNDQCAGEDGALRRKESEADCVQIMTMHVSKGLEYPVVFIAWGFGPLGYKVEKDKKNSAIREEKRLLYVALTRAEHKLYLPWSQWAQHQRTGNGAATNETGIGSVGSALLIPNDASKHDIGFLARGIRACFGSDDAAKEAVIKVSERAAKADAAATDNGQETGAEEGAAPEEKIKVYELDSKSLARQHVENDSYSSVRRKSKKAPEPDADTYRGDENHDGVSTQNVAPQNKEKTLLPRNNISGDVFHEIMETLCNNDDSDDKTLGFCTVGKTEFKTLVQETNSPLLSLIGTVMRRHQIASQKNEQGDDTTERVLARMVWRALNVPIAIGGRKIKLKDIKAPNRRAEAEFVVNRARTLGDELPSEDDPQRDSAFNGKIDLLIRPDGREGPVYVLDWKTNSLPDYDPETLKSAMTKSGYHLQYQFYSQAVRFWLHESELGGVAYLFVRAGEKSERLEGASGVFVAEAEEISQETCRTAIKEALKQEDLGHDS
ncbi:MAG: UvrD-helicase domain-containing protein [Kiritimatiellae bacterium]|nr:UvrD-helicase domain-containing protein [Kiritimatiellia bacterium]